MHAAPVAKEVGAVELLHHPPVLLDPREAGDGLLPPVDSMVHKGLQRLRQPHVPERAATRLPLQRIVPVET